MVAVQACQHKHRLATAGTPGARNVTLYHLSSTVDAACETAQHPRAPQQPDKADAGSDLSFESASR